MTEIPSPRQETPQEIFKRTARQVFFELTAKGIVSQAALSHSVNEFSASFSNSLQAARPWLETLGTGAFSAYLHHRSPPVLEATGDAFSLEVICVSLTNALRHTPELAGLLNKRLTSIFTKTLMPVSYLDMCALNALKDVPPLERLITIQAVAEVLDDLRSRGNQNPIELKFLIQSVRANAAKADERLAYLQSLCSNPSRFWEDTTSVSLRH